MRSALPTTTCKRQAVMPNRAWQPSKPPHSRKQFVYAREKRQSGHSFLSCIRRKENCQTQSMQRSGYRTCTKQTDVPKPSSSVASSRSRHPKIPAWDRC